MGFLEGKIVFITGGAGFIGQHLARKVRSMGGFVVGFEHDTFMPKDCVDASCRGDIRDAGVIRDAVFRSEPDYVFHLASQAIVGKGQSLSRYTLETNIMGSINLFQALADYNETHVLHGVVVASTDKTFGRHEDLPYTEDHALLGTRQVYETSKVCEDVLAQMACHSWNLPMGITRFGNVYGPGDSHLTRIVPSAIRSYMNHEAPVIRSNGQHYRDFVYIDDVVNGYIKLAEFVGKKGLALPAIFNFGTGVPVRVLDVVGMISTHFHDAKSPIIEGKAKEEIHRQYCDSTKAMKLLGWKAETKLREGIDMTIEWYKNA